MIQRFSLCPCPKLIAEYLLRETTCDAVVVVDVLRASTTILEALSNGAKAVIPVADSDQLKPYLNNNGYIVAGERGGIKLEFADLGNDPAEYTPQRIKGKTVVLSTTNGTQNIETIVKLRPNMPIFIGSVGNVVMLASLLEESYNNVLIAASGWNNTFSLEDSLYAALLYNQFVSPPSLTDDATILARMALENTKNNYAYAVKKSEHYQRLLKLIPMERIDYCLKPYLYSIVPFYYKGQIMVGR